MPLDRNNTKHATGPVARPTGAWIACLPGDCNGGGGPPNYGGGTPDQCAATETYCTFIYGDYSNDLLYTDGGGSDQSWTAYPWTCVQVGQSAVWSSPVDGLECDTWQIFHYFEKYCDLQTNTCRNNPAPPKNQITKISVEIGQPVTSGQFKVPGAGHLYVQLWSGTSPIGAAYEAGPGLGLCTDGLCLLEQSYAEHPNDDAHYFFPYIDGGINEVATLLAGPFNHYGVTCSPTFRYTPDYDPAIQNSNTFIDGLLNAADISQSAVSAIVSDLQSQSGLYPIGWQYGSNIASCF